MIFNSLNFIVFFPIVLIIYRVLPAGLKRPWLLAASLFFYACFDVRCLAVLAGVILISYFGAIFIENREKKGRVILISVILCLGILCTFKYLGFVTGNLNAVLGRLHISFVIPAVSLILPAGISFYTFKAVSYLADVYKGRIKAEKSFIDNSLYISFFPQIVAGPIDRADDLLKQIKEEKKFNADDFRIGILLMLWGFFEKLVIADRISGIVDAVYNDHRAYSGAAIAYATVCYGIQIYTDFAGYSHISIGASRMLGFKVKDNFRQPYLAVSIKDFWSRWHISMSTWFRDYVYIPLGGNRKGKARKYINNMITFLLSGLWHGSAWNFVVWGGLHGIYHLLSGMTEGFRNRVYKGLKIREDTLGRRLFRMAVTFIMVDYAWMFFRAGSLSTALDMTKRIFTDFRAYTLTDGWLFELGISEALIRTIPPALLLVIFVDILHEKGISIVSRLDEQGCIFRWLCYTCAVLLIILAAVQNLGISSGDFIYFRF